MTIITQYWQIIWLKFEWKNTYFNTTGYSVGKPHILKTGDFKIIIFKIFQIIQHSHIFNIQTLFYPVSQWTLKSRQNFCSLRPMTELLLLWHIDTIFLVTVNLAFGRFHVYFRYFCTSLKKMNIKKHRWWQ